MLSDSLRVKEENRVSGPRKKLNDPTNSHWSDEQKLEAVTTYLILGSLKQVSITLGIPFETLKGWKLNKWWKECFDELKEQDNLQLSARLQRVIGKSLDVVEDRLENGDHLWDSKEQKMIRKPVALRDAHRVGTDLIQRQQTLVSPQEQKMQEEGVKEKLEKLAQSFEAFANKQLAKPAVVVTDVVYVTEPELAPPGR